MSERHKLAGQKRGMDRTQEVSRRLEAAKSSIKDEMAKNQGIYPFNGGDVSCAEVVRRAGINESTLYKKKEANLELKESLEQWLTELRTENVVGRTRVRKTAQERLAILEEKYDALQNRHIETELELQRVEALYDELLAEKKSSNVIALQPRIK